MKWMIIILIMLSLIGSMMWVMPTKRQKYQAVLRSKAKTMGFQVQLEMVTAPRAKGEMEPESRTMTAYRIIRNGLSQDQKRTFRTWQVFRIESMADTGLPPGWSWSEGEGLLSPEQLKGLEELINNLPAGVFSIESTPVYAGVFWNEEEEEGVLEVIKDQLDYLDRECF